MVNTNKAKPVDLRKVYQQIYYLKEGPSVIEQLPERKYVSQRMITSFHMNWDGHPEPKDEKWIAFKVVNQIKQITKLEMNYRFKRMPPEMIWYQQKADNKWIVERMILVPDFISEEIYIRALEKVQKSLRVDTLPSISFKHEQETLTAMKLHVGHYKDTSSSLALLEKELQLQGYQMVLPHREIYLTPAMECYPAHKTKTVLSVSIQPIS